MRQLLQRSRRVRRFLCSRRGHHFVSVIDRQDRQICCDCGESRVRRPLRHRHTEVDLLGDLRSRYEAETESAGASDREHAA